MSGPDSPGAIARGEALEAGRKLFAGPVDFVMGGR